MSRMAPHRTPVETVERIVAFASVVFVFTACSKDSTSPTARVATAFNVVSGSAQSGTVNNTLAAPVVIEVTDQSGSPLAGAVVTFSPASGSVATTQVTTDASGLAQTAWTIGTMAGADSMSVSVASLSAVTVVATGTPDQPATITIISGNAQVGTAGASLGSALSVKVTDQFGNPVPNVPVQWSDNAGGSLAATTTTTDASGIAQDTYALGPSAGTDDVVATITVGSGSMAAMFAEQAN